MPMCSWKTVAGKPCAYCGEPATHLYGCAYMCCQCHGGDIITHEEALTAHIGALATRKAEPVEQAFQLGDKVRIVSKTATEAEDGVFEVICAYFTDFVSRRQAFDLRKDPHTIREGYAAEELEKVD